MGWRGISTPVLHNEITWNPWRLAPIHHKIAHPGHSLTQSGGCDDSPERFETWWTSTSRLLQTRFVTFRWRNLGQKWTDADLWVAVIKERVGFFADGSWDKRGNENIRSLEEHETNKETGDTVNHVGKPVSVNRPLAKNLGQNALWRR